MPNSSAQTQPPAPNCITCGYCLARLPGAELAAALTSPPTAIPGACPECGTPIVRSLLGGQLRFASDGYLRSLRRGLTLVLLGMAAWVLHFLGALYLPLVAGAAAGPVNFDAMSVAATIARLLVTGLFVAGYWLYTTPDPGYVHFESDRSARAVARWAVIAQAAGKLVALTAQLAHNLGQGRAVLVGTGTSTLTGGMATFLDWLSFGVLFLAITGYTRAMAQRVPDRTLAAGCTRYQWLLPLLSTAGLILCGIGPIIALILYASMLSTLRGHVDEVVQARSRSQPRHDPPTTVQSPSPPTTIPQSTTGNPPET